jgi:hypothetical protein
MLALRVAAAALLACLVGLAGATPSRGEVASPYLTQRDAYRVLVIGDLLAGGLFAGMDRLARGDQTIKVDGRFKEDSGLARPEIYNWPEALRKILEGQEIDIAVILVGSNDGQDMRPGGVPVAFGSPEWSAAYEAQVASLLDILKEHGTTAYWVGLPPMASPDYDARMRAIGERQATVLEARGIKLVDLRPHFGRPDGGYTDSGTDVTGATVRLRARNGVNFLKSGNDKLAKIVLDVIRADIETAANPPPVPAATAEAEPQHPISQTKQDAAIPMFGQGLVSGEAEVLSTENLPPVGAVAVNRAKADRAVSVEETEAKAGGSAAALYASGRWPAAKPGRVDDFTLRAE